LKLTQELLDHFINGFSPTLIKKDKDRFLAAIFLDAHSKENTRTVVHLMRGISDWDNVFDNLEVNDYTLCFLKKAKSNKVLNYMFVKADFGFFYKMILSCQFMEELIELLYLLANHYGFRLAYEINVLNFHFCCNKERINDIITHCTTIFEYEVDEQYKFLTHTIDPDSYKDVFEKIDAHFDFIQHYISYDFKFDYSNLKIPNWPEIAEQNHADYLTIPQLVFDPYEEENLLFGYDRYENDYDMSDVDQ